MEIKLCENKDGWWFDGKGSYREKEIDFASLIRSHGDIFVVVVVLFSFCITTLIMTIWWSLSLFLFSCAL